MNTLVLKIAGIIILVLVAIIVANIFWPTGSAPIAQAPDSEQIQQENKGILETRQLEAKQVVEPTKPKRPKTIRQETLNHQRAENLYQVALLQKEKSINSPNMNYEMVIGCCRQILERYPDSPQADKAKELLQEVPEQYRRQYSTQPKVKKSRSLRRMPQRRRHRPADITIEATTVEN
jgi:hypothetical protein